VIDMRLGDGNGLDVIARLKIAARRPRRDPHRLRQHRDRR
jgi:ActR/RegA family two-component response regulator